MLRAGYFIYIPLVLLLISVQRGDCTQAVIWNEPNRPLHQQFKWQGEKHPVFLESPVGSNTKFFGRWLPFEVCQDENTFVIAMKIRLYQGRLGGIKLFCGQPGTKRITVKLDAGAGPPGPGWTPTYFCEGPAIGFQMRFQRTREVSALEQSQINMLGGGKSKKGKKSVTPVSFDGEGATNVKIICSEFNETLTHQVIEDKDTAKKSTWLRDERCYKNQGICGLQVNIGVPNNGLSGLANSGEDDSGEKFGSNEMFGPLTIHGLRMKCCDILDPIETCSPHDKWELIVRYDNSDGLQKAQYSYSKKTGISKTVGTIEAMSQEKGVDIKGKPDGEWSIGEIVKLTLKFGVDLGYSRKTDFDWSQASSDTWSEEKSSIVNIEIEPGYITEIWQIVGVCGDYVIRPDKIFQTGSFSQKKQDRAARLGYDRLSQLDKLKIMGLMITLMGLSNYLL